MLACRLQIGYEFTADNIVDCNIETMRTAFQKKKESSAVQSQFRHVTSKQNHQIGYLIRNGKLSEDNVKN